jgi:hypothetical protein
MTLRWNDPRIYAFYLLAATYGDCACRIHLNIRSSDIGTWSEDGNVGCNPRYRSKNLKAAAKYSQGLAALKPRGYVHCRTPTFNSPIIRTES